MTDWMKHTVVMGLPRKGKTWLCIKMFCEIMQKMIFVNTQFEDIKDIMVKQSIIKDYTTVNYYTKSMLTDECNYVFNIVEKTDLRKMLSDVFMLQRAKSQCEPITIFIDEAHLYFPRHMNIDDIENVHIQKIFTLGLKLNIRLVLITQKPQMLCPILYTLCERMIVFKIHPNDITYFNRHNINIPLVTEDYKFEVVE